MKNQMTAEQLAKSMAAKFLENGNYDGVSLSEAVLKRCSTCREELPVECFGRDNRKKGGLQSKCRSCKRQSDEWKAARRESARRYQYYDGGSFTT